MLLRLKFLHSLRLRPPLKHAKSMRACLLMGTIAMGMSIDAHASGEDGATFAIRQGAEAQKEVERLLSQDKEIASMRKASSQTTEQSLQSLRGMKEQLKEIKAQAAQIVDRGNLIEGLNTKPGCPSQLFNKEGGSHGNCSPNPSQSSSSPVAQEVLPPKNKDQLLVFVSFSMPEVSLKRLANDAEKHNAVLVMRGLYEDSFVKTANKLKDLEIGVDINPELFEVHQVTAVPTFVAVRSNKPLWHLKGNVTLDFVVKTFNDQPIGTQLVVNQSISSKHIETQRIDDQGEEQRS